MQNLKARIAVAIGNSPGTLLINNVSIANVITRELQENQSILILKDTIVAVGPTNEFSPSQASEVVDGLGLVATPSFVDCHLHIESSMLSLENFAKIAAPSGTGAIVIDPHELVNVSGIRAFNWLKESAVSVAPLLNVWLEIPSCVPATPFETAGASLTVADVNDLFSQPNASYIVGLAEMMNFPGVLSGNDQTLRKISASLSAGKIVEGHAPGLTGRGLNGYLAAGIESDHEAITGEEALEKLRLGMKIQIRYGSLAKDLESIVRYFADQKIDTRHCMLVSDDRHPNELLKTGHLNEALQECVRLGVNPLEALQWVTINPMTHLRLNHQYGSIAPGKKANITLLSSLEKFSVAAVIHHGKLISKHQKLLIPIPAIKAPQDFFQTMKLEESLAMEDFQLKTRIKVDEVGANVIGVQEGSLLTKHLTKQVKITHQGIFQPSIEEDILPISVVERHGNGGHVSVGLVSGFGLQGGALASTVAHDSHNVIAVGTDSKFMLKAVRELKALGGGICAVNSDKIVSVPLPICGLLSLDDAAEVSSQVDFLISFIDQEIGTDLNNPPMSLSFLALPVIPALKITDKGLFDVTKFEFIDVFNTQAGE
ncbi:MAG: adenine deaminase [Candidatus Heimdallarchaeota archaeon]